jgi:hypothetical protein
MAYGKSYAKKPVFKKRTYRKRPTYRKNTVAKTVKSIMYKQMETKSRIEVSSAELALFHNVPRLISSNLLITSQGVDGDGRSGNRIGSAVNPIGIKLYIECSQWQPAELANFLNGDMKIKLWILKTHHSNVNTSNDFLRYINTNSLMAPVERRTHNTVKTMVINLTNQYSGSTSGQVVDVTPAFQTRIVWIHIHITNSFHLNIRRTL